jgi:hypothetical protein
MGKKSRNRRAAAVDPPRGGAAGSQVGGRSAPERRRQSPLAATSAGALGIYLGVPFGLGLLALGLLDFLRADPLPWLLALAVCLAGALEVALCWMTRARSRAAWSFAVALNGTLTLGFLFGAPKIRDTLAWPIGLAILPALVALLVTCFLAAAASDISSRSA